MKRENSNRTRRFQINFTPEEYTKIESKYRESTCTGISDYIRNHLFNKPIVTTYRNLSLDDLMEETILLTKELNAIRNDFNQIDKKFNTVKTTTEFNQQLLFSDKDKERLFTKMEEIKNHTQKIAEQWLQS